MADEKVTPVKKTSAQTPAKKTATKKATSTAKKTPAKKTASKASAAKKATAKKTPSPSLGAVDSARAGEALTAAPAAAVKIVEAATPRGVREELQESIASVAAVAQEQYHEAKEKGPSYILVAPAFVVKQGIRGAKATGRAVWQVTPAQAKKLLSR